MNSDDAIKKKHLCFFAKKHVFFFCEKNLASKKKKHSKSVFFLNTHLKEITI